MCTKLKGYSQFIKSQQAPVEGRIPHISLVRMRVIENLEETVSNPEQIQFAEKLIWVRDIVWSDGELKKDIKLQCFLWEAFEEFKKFEQEMDEEIDRRLLILNPLRENIIHRLHNISPDNAEEKKFLRRILDWILCANILDDKLIENLLIIVQSLGVINIDDIIMLKDVIEQSNPMNLYLVYDKILRKNNWDDRVPANIALLDQLSHILADAKPENLEIILESEKHGINYLFDNIVPLETLLTYLDSDSLIELIENGVPLDYRVIQSIWTWSDSPLPPLIKPLIDSEKQVHSELEWESASEWLGNI